MILRDYLIALVFVSFIFIGSFSFITGMANEDPALSEQLSEYESFDQINRTLNFAKDMQGDSNGLIAILKNIPLGGEIAAVTLGATQILATVFKLPDIYSALLKDVIKAWGLPEWLFWGITAIVMIAVTFTIVSAINKWRT